MRAHGILCKEKKNPVALLLHIQSTIALFWFLFALRLCGLFMNWYNDDHSTDQ